MIIALTLAAMLTAVITASRSPARGAEEPLGDDVHHAAFQRGQLRHRDRVDVEQVQDHVEQHDRAGAQRQGARQEALGVADLFGDVRRRVPSRVAEHHRHERQQPAAGAQRTRRFDVRPRSVAQAEAQKHEQDEEGDLGRGQQVLHDAPRPDAAHVHQRQQHDERDGHQRLRRHGEVDGPEAALEQRTRVGAGGNESSEVEGKARRRWRQSRPRSPRQTTSSR